MRAEVRRFPTSISADGLKNEVARASESADVHGVLVQLPLPAAIEEHESATTNKFDIFDAIVAEKDVDGVGRGAVAKRSPARSRGGCSSCRGRRWPCAA